MVLLSGENQSILFSSQEISCSGSLAVIVAATRPSSQLGIEVCW